jgi:hypothetical protein
MQTADIAQTIELLKAAKPLFQSTQDSLAPWVGVVGAIGGALAAIAPAAVMAKIARKEKATSTMLQIYAEIKSLLEIERYRKYSENLSKIIEAFKEGHIKECSYKVELSDDKFPVYKANLANLGLLPPMLQVKIVHFYQTGDAISQDIKPGGLLNASSVGLNPFENVFHLMEAVKGVGAEVLTAIEKIHPTLTENYGRCSN